MSHAMQMNQVVANQSPMNVPMPRIKTPPSEEVDVEASAQEGGRGGKGKGVNKGKNVGWKDKDEREKVAQKVEPDYNSDLGSTLSKEIKKSEESLHNRLGRLIAKELDKQRTCMRVALMWKCLLMSCCRLPPRGGPTERAGR